MLLGNPAIQAIEPVPPSIPNKHQSYGYEQAQDGRLVLQEPSRQGFSGLGTDTVGPGDYEPDVRALDRRGPGTVFSKVTTI